MSTLDVERLLEESRAWESFAEPEDGEDGAAAYGGVPEAAPAPGPPQAAAPRCVTRGAKLQDVIIDRGIKVDWARLTGPRGLMPAVKAECVKLWGEPEQQQGRFFYAWRHQFECGAWIGYGSKIEVETHVPGPGDTFVLDMSGSVCTGLGDEVMPFLRLMVALGLKATRLDLAADFHVHEDDQEGVVGLVDAMREACEVGELCRAKRWEPRRPMSGRRLVGNGVCIGKPGKLGSGRYVRCYDKGLERNAKCEGPDRPTVPARPGEWERFETEFSGECAEQALNKLCEVEEWWVPAWPMVFGAIDFREVVEEGDNRGFERRERSSWWAEVLEWVLGEMEPKTIKASREPPELKSWLRHMRKVFLPTLVAMMERADWSVVDAWEWILQEAGAVDRHLVEKKRPVLWQFMKLLERRGRSASVVKGTPF